MYISKPNRGKDTKINTVYGRFVRYPIAMPLIRKGDDLAVILKKNFGGG